MATKRDLVEAHAFSRRRLVTAFVSGAPGGREVEPARPGRVLIGGVALTVLLIAGAAVAGIFTKKTPDDWAKQGLFVSKQTGAAYVITDGGDSAILRPVINITSAKLILGAETVPTIVTQQAIDAETVGDDIGIVGAPASPPAPDRLIETGWLACTDDGAGVRLTVGTGTEASPVDGGGAVVHVGDDYYLLARSAQQSAEAPSAYAYRLPREASQRDNMLGDLGLRPSTFAAAVDEPFLALFPTGGDLAEASMGLTGVGEPAPYADARSNLPADAKIGDLVRTERDNRAYLLTQNGPAALDPFAVAVFGNLPHGRELTMSRPLGIAQAKPTYLEAHWPDTTLTPVLGQACAQLDAKAGSTPRVSLLSNPGVAESAAAVDAGAASVQVEAGRGAYVLSGDWPDSQRGSPYLVDATGKAFPLVGAGTAGLLGYAEVAAPVVPDSWIELFEPGVSLSQDLALCPPAPEKGTPCA